MTTTMQRGIALGVFLAVSLTPVLAMAATVPQVQTQSAANVQGTSAGLNGYLSDLGGYTNATVWFQYGTNTSYGSQTSQLTQSYTGQFNQTVSGLAANTTYHFRAVAQNTAGTTYGQDLTFTTGGNSSGSQITVNAGPDLYLSSGQQGVLQGYGYDAGGNSVTYYWSCSGGTLSSNTNAQATITVPVMYGQGTYTCTLTVQNNYGGSNSDTVYVYVNGGNSGNTGNYYGSGFYAQTNQPTNISNGQAVLQGFVSGGGYSTYAWFEWGTNQNFGNSTIQQALNYSATYTQNLANLQANTTYYYRAAARQANGSTVYGQTVSFNSTTGATNYNYNNNNYPYYGSGPLQVTVKAINVNSGNYSWQPSVNANAGDTVSFSVILQSTQDVQNVTVRDLLPAGLTYQDNLTFNTGNYTGNITSGVNIGTIYANQPVILSYQVRVNPVQYGTSTLTNSVTVTSSQGSQNGSASVLVTNQSVLGATYISTGIANDLVKDSFLIPVILLALIAWLYFTGRLDKAVRFLVRK